MAVPFRVAGIPILSGLPAKSLFQEPIYVSSVTGSADNDGRNPRYPAATVAEVFSSNKVATNGSIIVGPSHAESVSAAAGMVCDIAGVHILGLGEGSARPTITFTTVVGADVDIDADNITFENLIFDATGFDALTGPIDVNAAYFTMKNCQLITADAGGQATDYIILTATADFCTIEECRIIGSSNAGADSAIQMNANDQFVLRNTTITGEYAVACVEVVSGAATNLLIEHNDMNNLNSTIDRCIVVIASTTGTIRYNTLQIDGNTETTPIKGTNNDARYEN